MKNGKEAEVFVKILKENIPSVMKNFSGMLEMLSEEFTDKNGPISSEDIECIKEELSKGLGDFQSLFEKENTVVWDEWEKLEFIFAIRMWEAKRSGWDKLLQFSNLFFDECFDLYYCGGIGSR
jgi:hypothetical protein